MSDAPLPEDEFLGDIQTNGESPFLESVIGDEPETETIPDPIPEPDTEPVPPPDEPIGDGTCAICGAPTFRPPGLTKSGRRKRVPKHCDLHTKNVRVPDEGPDVKRLESQLQRIQVELADQLKLAGVLTGPLFPVTGYYMQENADQFTTALLQTAKDKERLLRILYRAAQVAPIYTLLSFGAGVGISMQVDQNRHDPHSGFSRHLGVEQAYEAVHGTTTNHAAGNGNTVANGQFTPPPKYATVQ